MIRARFGGRCHRVNGQLCLEYQQREKFPVRFESEYVQ